MHGGGGVYDDGGKAAFENRRDHRGSLYFDEIFSALRDSLFYFLYSGTSLKAGDGVDS